MPSLRNEVIVFFACSLLIHAHKHIPPLNVCQQLVTTMGCYGDVKYNMKINGKLLVSPTE